MKNKKIVLYMVLVAIVVGSIAYYAGFKHAEGSALAANASGQFRGGNRGGRMGGNLAGGTVIAKDATSITVEGRDGSSKIVFFSAATPVMKMVAGASADIAIGKEVTITGKANADGSISADTISIRPAVTQKPASTQ